jgi:glycosyltransferase involved in cell wall biosynthesis
MDASINERRLRVLVIADSCNPEWESIPLEGWSHAHALSKLADIHIVTRSWNNTALLRAGLIEGRDFTSFDTERLYNPVQSLVHRISGKGKGFALLQGLSIPSYMLLEHLAWRRFRAALINRDYDLVHRLTPLSPAVPSLLAARCRRIGVPFVLGPINGGLPWPPGFPGLSKLEGEFAYRLRGLHRYLPGYRATRNCASAIIIGSATAKADLPARWHAKTCYIPENGIETDRFPPRQPREAALPLKAVFLGRLVPYKGADMLLDAAADFLSAGTLRLDILGDGPERQSLEAQVRRLGIEAAVTFTGWVNHKTLGERLRQVDLLTFPSVHEFGGAVVLEAMASGAVPIVVGYGGPAELATAATGIVLPLSDRAGTVASLRAALARLTADPSQIPPMSARATRRALALFSWDNKARQTLEVWRWVLGLRPDKPDLPLPLSDSPLHEYRSEVGG